MRALVDEANGKARPGATVLHRKPNREWAGDMPKITSRADLAAETKVTMKRVGEGYSTNFAVKRRVVNGEAYRARFSELGIPKRASQSVHQQALRILEDRDGTAGERLCAISWKSGELVADTFGTTPSDFASGFTNDQIAKIEKTDGGVVLLHNHPASGPPSATDICTLAQYDWARASVIVCHNGTIYAPRVLNGDVTKAYNAIKEAVVQAHPEMTDRDEIERRAQDYLFKENEKAKWFKITKK